MPESLDLFCWLLFLMAAGHAIADRPLQEGVLRADKYAPRGKPGDYRWLSGLTCHALIHGGFVAVITGLWWLGVAETVSHWLIDDQTVRKRFTLVVDQALHAVCKGVWALAATGLAAGWGWP